MNTQNIKIDPNEYDIVEYINEGANGIVYCVKHLETEELFAAKVIQKVDSSDEDGRRAILNEVKVLKQCLHPTLIHFYGLSTEDFYGDSRFTLFFEYCKNGSLENLLNDVQHGTFNSLYDNTMRQIILIGIARGMMYLHQHRILHRDLKPGNVLLDDDFNPHITDFGLSQTFEKYEGMHTGSVGEVGTPIYMAPEIIEDNEYSPKVDVYAFGILMYEVVTDSTPYPGIGHMLPQRFLHLVLNGQITIQFNVPVKKSIKSLIERCINRDPLERPSFEDIYTMLSTGKDPVLDDIDDDPHRYFLDDVDDDAVQDYVDQIRDDEGKKKKKESVDELTKKVEEMAESLECIKGKTDGKRLSEIKEKKDDKMRIDKLEKEIKLMKIEKKQFRNKVDQQLKQHLDIINNRFRIFASSVTSITIPDDMTTIPHNFFSQCNKLKVVVIPNSVTSIGSCAFEGCSELTDVSIPETVTDIGSHAFSRCFMLSHVSIPPQLTVINKYAFFECRSLKKIVIPSSVTLIEKYSFFHCKLLKKVVIPKSVLVIQKYAFKCCTSLQDLSVSSDTTVEDGAFSGCESLKNPPGSSKKK